MNHRVLGRDPFASLASSLPATASKPTGSYSRPSPSTGPDADKSPSKNNGSSALKTRKRDLAVAAKSSAARTTPKKSVSPTTDPVPAVDQSDPTELASMQLSEGEIDCFGFDPRFAQRSQRFMDFLLNRYFRVQLEGTENLDLDKPFIMVANHAGGLPYDAVILNAALRSMLPVPAPIRPLLEDRLMQAPFLNVWLSRLGCVRASPSNARHLLAAGQSIAVFPEGARGRSKLYTQRYQLQRFGRGGFVKLALRTGTPIVPVAIVGSEEIHPHLARITQLVDRLGLSYLPVTPTFPMLGPLGLAPLPSRWRIVIGPVDRFAGHSADSADDPVVVHSLTLQTQNNLQDMLDQARRDRGNTFLTPASPPPQV